MQKPALRRLPLLIAAAFASEWIYAADAAQDAEQVQLEEVVVTGERTNRSGFETATSNRVFTAPNIDRSGHNLSATDLLKQTVNTVDLGSGNDLPTVRGVDGSGPAVGAVAFFAGTRPRLNLSIDGRSATYNEYAFGTQSLWDMQQVEVLRGPQSHVRGQNAVAGAVVMRSKDPTDEWEGALRLGLGNQKTRNIAGVVSGPIVKNNLAFRLSAERQQRKLRAVRVLRADRQPAPCGKHQRTLQTPAHARKPSRFLQPPDAEPHPFARAAKRNHGQYRQPPFFKRKARVRNRLDIRHLGRIVAA